MRILHLTPGTGHFYCGSCLRDNALVLALRERGHDAMMVPLYLPHQVEDRAAAQQEPVLMGGINMYLQHKLRFLRWIPRPLARVLDRPALLRWASRRGNMTDAHELGDLTLSMVRGEEGRQAAEIDRMVAWLEHQEPQDVLCLSNVMLLGLVRRLREHFKAPIVCTLQGEAPFLDALPSPARERSWEELARRARDVDAFVPVSRYYGDLMRERLQLPPERVHVVYNGIDLSDWPAGEDGTGGSEDSPPTVGYLARMCRDKGLHTLVDAFILLKQRGALPGARLRVAGVRLAEDEPWVGELIAALQRAGCADDVEWLPNIDRDEKLRFLSSLDVLSVPATYGESFGLYLLEGLASGVPFVQPRHASFPELAETTGGGVLCEPDDAASLADGLGQLLGNRVAAREMGERGRAAVSERFGVDRMARDVEELFSRLAFG